MADQATSAQPTPIGDADPEVAELRGELRRSRQEVLRLRDLLIGKDAELGVLRGRMTELEEGSARFLTAAFRLWSRTPRLARTAAAGLRRLRRRRG
jgi:hypothetical protein